MCFETQKFGDGSQTIPAREQESFEMHLTSVRSEGLSDNELEIQKMTNT